VHVGIAGAKGEPSLRVHEFPSLQGVVTGLGEHGHGEDHREMGPHVWCEADSVPGGKDEGSVTSVGEQGEDKREEHGDAYKIHQHAEQRHRIHVEGGVLVEQGVGVAELLPVQEQQHLLPAAPVGDPHDQCHHHGHGEQQLARPAAARYQFQDVAAPVGVHGTEAGGELARQPHAAIEDAEEDQGEEEPHQETTQEGSPKDVGVAHLLVPEVVGPEIRDDGPEGHEQAEARKNVNHAAPYPGLEVQKALQEIWSGLLGAPRGLAFGGLTRSAVLIG
jgi:hypothetical protein